MKRIMGFLLIALLLASQGAAGAEQYMLLKGDLHCHSSFSHDSDVKAEQVIADSITAGYDFISLTEHNTTRHMKTDLSTDELIVIAGYEYTIRAGHYNLFGIRNFSVRTGVNRAELIEQLASLHELGALIQLNHPNDVNYYSKYGYDMAFDMLEVINGRVTADDLQTIEEYQTLLASGRKVIATGGTDAHRNHTTRTVFDNVLVTERSEAGILEALRAGRNFVTTELNGPVLSMSCGEAVMGDTVAYETGQTITIEIENLAKGSFVRIYTDQGLYSETKEQDNAFHADVPTEGFAFVRVEAWNGPSDVAAISNPIYIQ